MTVDNVLGAESRINFTHLFGAVGRIKIFKRTHGNSDDVRIVCSLSESNSSKVYI